MRIAPLHRFAAPVILGLVYFIAARLSLQLAFAGSNASPIWPPTGIAIAALTFWGLRLAPAVTVAAFAANLFSFHASSPDLPIQYWLASAVIALGNTAEAFVGAWLLRSDAEFPKLFHSQRSVLRFVLVALLVSAISASVGTASLVIAEIIPAAIQITVSVTWWIGDACGALIFVPFVAIWTRGCRAAVSPTPVATASRFILSLVCIGLISWFVFGHWINDPALLRPLVFLIFPALGWVAWQYGLRGACSSLIVIATFAVIGTTRGFGPFATGQLNESLVLLDSFLALIAITALLLSSDRLERMHEGFSNSLREYAPPGIALLAAIGLTVLAWHLLSLDSERRAEERFGRMTVEIEAQINDRMHDYQRALRGGAGLFVTSKEVTRSDWQAYTQTLRLQESLPGIQGMGFSLRVAANGHEALTKKMQAGGYPEFSIKPPGIRKETATIIYLEPLDRRNQRVIGYDLMSEPIRRATLTHARDTGQTTISDKIILLQEDASDTQAGFLMIEPVYRQRMDTSTIESRRQALIGYVHAPFRANDLMLGTLGHHWPEVWLEVLDGAGTQAGQSLYTDAALQNGKTTTPSRFVQEKKLAIFEHAWTLRMHSSPAFEAAIDRQKSQFVFVAGGIVSLLLFAMFRLQSLTTARAEKLAKGITNDLQQTQLALEQREKFATVIFETTPEPLMLIDSSGNIVRANTAAARSFGYRQEELTTLTVEALVPVDFRAHHPKLRDGFLAGNESRPMGIGRELRAQRADGSMFPVEVALAPLKFGEEKFVVVSVIDITAHKMAEAAIKENERFLHTVTDSIPGLISYWNRDLHCRFANASYAEWFGKTPGQMQGIHMQDLLGEAAFNISIHHFQGVMKGVPQNYERTLTKQNGEKHHGYIQFIPDFDNSEVCGFIALLTDITDLKNAQLALESSNNLLKIRTQEAESASRAKGDFLANMSHEIRTPMNAVIGLSQLLEDTSLDNRQRDYVKRIRSSSKALLAILNDVLDYSKIEAGHLQIEAVDFRVEELLKNTADLFSFACSEKDIELFLELAPTVPLVLKGDPLRIGQVLHNLVGNAIKFTPHGEIHVKLDAEPVGRGGILNLKVTVRDSGIGMDTEQCARLFRAFEQADTSTTRKYGGTGLGLSICKRLVKLMGGDISVVSQSGAGSTFSFNVYVGVGTDTGSNPSKHAQHDLQALRTLVVDDQPVSLEVLQQTLKTWGCIATVTSRSTDALRLVTEAAAAGTPFELLLLDWQMPEMDGLELARRIDALAKQGVLPTTPRIIMVTAHGREQLDKARAGTRIDAILEKPVLPSQLFDAIVDLQQGKVTSLAAASANDPHWSLLTAGVQGARILLVEDNKTNQLVAQEFLSAMGMQVELANDGQEAVDMVLKNDFDLVLMDLQMPVMDGFDATTAIRAIDKGKELPIVAMTAAAMVKDRMATEAAGMNDHLSKPIEPEKLAHILLRWLPKRTKASVSTQLKKHKTAADEQPISLAGLDLDSAWKRLDQRWSMVRKVCLGFAEDFGDAVAQLEAFLHKEDHKAAARLVHTVKGLALNVGASDLHRVAAAFEQELKHAQTTQRTAFEQALTHVLAAIAGLRQQAAGDATPSTAGMDATTLISQLRDLQTMLSRKQGRARKAAKEIEGTLTGSALHTDFQNVVGKVERLKFDEASELLQQLISQHFADPE
jgi:PAS domain S-box-containing protein